MSLTVIDTYGWCPVCGADDTCQPRCRLAEGWALLDDPAAIAPAPASTPLEGTQA